MQADLVLGKLKVLRRATGPGLSEEDMVAVSELRVVTP